jgi:hypothetical protein
MGLKGLFNQNPLRNLKKSHLKLDKLTSSTGAMRYYDHWHKSH